MGRFGKWKGTAAADKNPAPSPNSIWMRKGRLPNPLPSVASPAQTFQIQTRLSQTPFGLSRSKKNLCEPGCAD